MYLKKIIKFNLHIIGRVKKGCEFNQKRCEFKILVLLFLLHHPLVMGRYLSIFGWQILAILKKRQQKGIFKHLP